MKTYIDLFYKKKQQKDIHSLAINLKVHYFCVQGRNDKLKDKYKNTQNMVKY